MEPPSFSVCVAPGDGSLVIKESLIQMWTKDNPTFEPAMNELVKAHNEEWNKKGLKRGLEAAEQTGQPGKKLRLDPSAAQSHDHESQIEDRTVRVMFGSLIAIGMRVGHAPHLMVDCSLSQAASLSS